MLESRHMSYLVMVAFAEYRDLDPALSFALHDELPEVIRPSQDLGGGPKTDSNSAHDGRFALLWFHP